MPADAVWRWEIAPPSRPIRECRVPAPAGYRGAQSRRNNNSHIFAFNCNTTIFYCLFPAELFPLSQESAGWLFFAAEINFLITNRATNIIASSPARLINLASHRLRCIYWVCNVLVVPFSGPLRGWVCYFHVSFSPLAYGYVPILAVQCNYFLTKWSYSISRNACVALGMLMVVKCNLCYKTYNWRMMSKVFYLTIW